MSSDVIVLGAGGHASVVIDALRRTGHVVTGVCAPDLAKGQFGPLGAPGLGSDDALAGFERTAYLLANGIGSTGSPALRQHVFDDKAGRGWSFVVLAHPTSFIGADCMLAEGAQIMAGAVLQTRVRIGRNTIVNTSASIDHDCKIGDHAHIAPGAVLSGNVTIGARSHIGVGAVVIQGIAIGDNVLIGAGAVITRTVASGEHIKAGARH